MTFINWMGIGLMAAIIITGILLLLYYKKKMRELDGFVGIMVEEEEIKNE